jgi:hypothetical protein
LTIGSQLRHGVKLASGNLEPVGAFFTGRSPPGRSL